MKNILEILKEYGIEIPEDKKESFNKTFAENYKTVAEMDKKNKKIENLEGDVKSLEGQLETANETIKGFDGVDVEGQQKQIKEYQDKIKEMEETHKKELYDRDFSDALTAAMEEYKFSSEYAKKSVIAEIKEAGLKLVDGKIIGLNDMVETIKEKDASAFVDEEKDRLEQNKAKFSSSIKGKKDGGKMSMAELMKAKNENPDMDISQYLGKDE